jgi:hypothetical protein
MIVHQYVGVDQNTKSIVVIRHELKQLLPVGVVLKYLLPLIPSAGYMIQRPRIFYSYRPAHKISIPPPFCQISRPDTYTSLSMGTFSLIW